MSGPGSVQGNSLFSFHLPLSAPSSGGDAAVDRTASVFHQVVPATTLVSRERLNSTSTATDTRRRGGSSSSSSSLSLCDEDVPLVGGGAAAGDARRRWMDRIMAEGGGGAAAGEERRRVVERMIAETAHNEKGAGAVAGVIRVRAAITASDDELAEDASSMAKRARTEEAPCFLTMMNNKVISKIATYLVDPAALFRSIRSKALWSEHMELYSEMINRLRPKPLMARYMPIPENRADIYYQEIYQRAWQDAAAVGFTNEEISEMKEERLDILAVVNKIRQRSKLLIRFYEEFDGKIVGDLHLNEFNVELARDFPKHNRSFDALVEKAIRIRNWLHSHHEYLLTFTNLDLGCQESA